MVGYTDYWKAGEISQNGQDRRHLDTDIIVKLVIIINVGKNYAVAMVF